MPDAAPVLRGSSPVEYHPRVDTLVILLIVLVIVVVWRGPKTLPQIGSMLGRGVKAAREEAKGIRGGESDPGDTDAGDPPSR